MNEKIATWDDLQLFIAVARNGGLSPAARKTGRSAATLGRRMQALERLMGQELFLRHDRGYLLTSDGTLLFEKLCDIEPELSQLTVPRTERKRALVKVSAGTWTTLVLLSHIKDIVGSPADVRLRFVAAENVLNIAHREVVIGFRNRRPTEDTMAGRKLRRVKFAIYARPGAPDDWIKITAQTPSARWLDKVTGDSATCEVNTPRNGLDLVLAGIGKAVLPTFIGDHRAELERRGDTIQELAHDQWLVSHHDDRQLPEVRRVIDRLYAIFEPVR